MLDDLTPYPCQARAVDHAEEFLRGAGPGERRAYEGPTGVGKSVVELLLQRRMGAAECPILTPREEVADGMMEKLGRAGEDPASANIWTPIRYRNRLADGRVKPPRFIIWDENHHHEAESWQDVDMLSGLAPAVGFSATQFRGTPRSTAKFRERWGPPVVIATWAEAAALGYVRIPEFHVLPLVDDDVVDVVNGKFEVTSLVGATVDRLGDLVLRSKPWHDGARWGLPTMYAVPTTDVARRLARELNAAGLPAAAVGADTPKAERRLAFKACEGGLLALVQIAVVSEGVDLKVRRLVDAHPMLSPVEWLQQFGRCTRPWDRAPQYVCTNRNLARHAYLLAGVVPSSRVAAVEKAFGPTTRPHVRALGLESLGRFKPSSAPLVNGARVYVYSLYSVVGADVVDWCCLVPPTGEPVWARRVSGADRAETGAWGSWAAAEPPADLRGYQSKAPSAISDKQRAWWARAAGRHGLDATAEPDAKAFQALPVLKDLNLRVS